jgi:hypothetical protein
MPQTKNIDLPTVANFDATLKAAGFFPSEITGHYFVPYDWDLKMRGAIANMARMERADIGFPVSRATAMQCLCLYVENFT